MDNESRVSALLPLHRQHAANLTTSLASNLLRLAWLSIGASRSEVTPSELGDAGAPGSAAFSSLTDWREWIEDKWEQQGTAIAPVSAVPTIGATVRTSDFDAYLERIEPVLTTFLRHLAADSAADASTSGASGAADLELSTELAEERDAIRLEIEKVRKEVPALFFDEEFRIERAAHFDLACGRPDGYQQQQEALSHYLDTVEMCLIKQINRKAGSFFDALSTLQRLHVDMTETLTSVGTATLREILSLLVGHESNTFFRSLRRHSNVAS